ncbi:cupin domain-containing protein [Paenibacillus sp. 22594]|uniref:cupin domain-containing protein n=1 Tax=Paenibacillus sp. 22594 TaxID=3453947 RepID=UPI003F846925
MKIYRFVKETGKNITAYHSNFIMSRIIRTEKSASIGCMYLEENGIIGYHQAAGPQLLLMMSGEGLVRGRDTNFIKVQAGDAVFWEEGEWHETRSETGMTAIVIESVELNPAAYMSSI